MPSSIRRIDVAGRDITEYMQLLLRKSGYVFHTSAEKEVVRMIKEKMSFVALDPKKEEKEWATNMGRAESKMVEYVLPDGNKLKVCRVEDASCSQQLTISNRLEQNGSEPPKSSSTPRSLASSIQESTKSWSMPLTEPIWICANRFLAILFFPEAARLRKGSEIDYFTRSKDWL